MPKFYMLIGVPGAGKSTWVNAHRNNMIVVSSDNYIEQQAAQNGTSYNDEFSSNIKAANQKVKQDLKAAFEKNSDIIHDQTNLTKKSRASKLQMIPNSYEKIAVYFPTPHPDIHEIRLASRPGKSIPYHVLDSMIKTLEPPSKAEGFNEIVQA